MLRGIIRVTSYDENGYNNIIAVDLGIILSDILGPGRIITSL